MAEDNEFTDAERERLAVLCGYDVVEKEYSKFVVIDDRNCLLNLGLEWKPDSLESPQWQIHAITNEIKKRGLSIDLKKKLEGEMFPHPAKICRTVLSVIEGDDE